MNSISVKSNELEVSIYPNLTVGQFTIEFYENIEKGMAWLIGVNGRLLLQRTLDNQRVIWLIISELSVGICFLEIQTSKGIYNQKIIKK